MKIEIFDSGHELNHHTNNTERTYTHKLTYNTLQKLNDGLHCYCFQRSDEEGIQCLL